MRSTRAIWQRTLAVVFVTLWAMVLSAFGPNAMARAEASEPSAVVSAEAEDASPHVWYRTHVQTYGWQKFVRDGATSGTSGKAKRLEGIRIKVSGLEYEGGIKYRTHVQTYGWQSYVTDGAMSGTSGRSKRLEAIQINLTGEAAKHYDVWYRVHAQRFGWMGWALNGMKAGSEGYALRLEAIQIRIVPRGAGAPGSTTGAFRKRVGSADPYASVLRVLKMNSEDKVVHYTYADVYGDSNRELFCLMRPYAGSGYTWRIYTLKDGSPKKMLEDTHGRYFDQEWTFYKGTDSFTLHGGGRGYETYRNFQAQRNDSYREVAACGRWSTLFGNPTTTAWEYTFYGFDSNRAEYDAAVAPLRQGNGIKVKSSSYWSTYR